MKARVLQLRGDYYDLATGHAEHASSQATSTWALRCRGETRARTNHSRTRKPQLRQGANAVCYLTIS